MDKDRKMEEIRTRFAEGSSGYDERIRKIIPRYDEMLGALISSVGHRKGRIRVIASGSCWPTSTTSSSMGPMTR